MTLEETLARVKAAWPDAKWEWDGRFSCALSTVPKAHAESARVALTEGLGSIWTPATLATAPDLVKQLCAQTGGLLGGQLVFSADLDDAFTYCLWWPWGSGANVSARLGAAGDIDMTAALRGALGIK